MDLNSILFGIVFASLYFVSLHIYYYHSANSATAIFQSTTIAFIAVWELRGLRFVSTIKFGIEVLETPPILLVTSPK